MKKLDFDCIETLVCLFLEESAFAASLDGSYECFSVKTMLRLTHAPLPEWANMAEAVVQKNATDSLLAEPWVRGNEIGFWFSRSAWSLYVVAQFRRRVTGRADICIWFPDYFCNASIAPLRDLGVEIVFYPINVDGNPDLAACEVMLDKSRPDIIVLVHYFGEPTPATELARFAQNNGAWLVEDSAHVLRPADGIGEFGDFILYSPHKFLSIPDGALLLVRRNSSGKITNDLLERYDLKGLCQSLTGRSCLPARAAYEWMAKRLLQKLGVRLNNFGSPGFHDDVLIMDAGNFIRPRMSSLARKLLFGIINSLDEEAKAREVNRQEWCIGLAKDKVIGGSMVSLQATNTPYLAGFSCDETIAAEKIFNLLNKAKIPVTTWPDLPPEVSKNPIRHKVAVSMRETRIFFPVHRSINPRMIQFALKNA